jgi:hypothetical protein
MTADDIIVNVVDRIQDSAFDEDAILALINEARSFIASEVDLPALRKSADLITSSATAFVALPIDYQKGIYWVGSVNQGCRIGKRPGDYYNMLTFMERYPVEVGPIEAVCVEGVNLLYRNKATDTLTVKYYRKPTDITDTSTEPAEIPAHLQRPLLAAYCCREIYADIEDGMEGAKVNTAYWSKKFDSAMQSLAAFVARNQPREAKYTRDMNA